MIETKILLPSKPKVIKDDGIAGTFEIENLYPGYGHTLGNSLRRIILSSIEGAAITSLKIKGVSHEFSSIEGVKENVVTIILNLKKARVKLNTSEPQTVRLQAKGIKTVTAADIKLPGQVEILNPDQYITELTDKNAEIDMEIEIQSGLGYVPKEVIQKDRVEIGSIAVDAIFSPVRRVSYEVENMRVGDRTDFNRLRINIETNGSITPKDALERSIVIMIEQLKAVVGFKEEELEVPKVKNEAKEEKSKPDKEALEEILKTRTESLDISQRTINALNNANIRTVGGLARKKEKDLLEIEGLGTKGIQEIKAILRSFNIELK